MKHGNFVNSNAARRLAIALLIILFAAAVGGTIALFATAQPDDFSTSTIEKDENDNSLDKSGRNCVENAVKCAAPDFRGGVVVEATSRRVLVNENMNARCYPASTTKVLTALVVLDKLPLDKVVVVPREAVGIEGSSIYLKEGEKITVEDLLLGLMLRSGNDSAAALAIAVSGSVEEFSALMNDKAKECGAYSSNFVNPHGLHDDNHYTTPYDLALITAKAYENKDFCRIVNTQIATISGADGEKHIGNKNKLLKLFADANGVKTGYTKKSGRCLVGGAKREGMQLVSVVLNYNDMWNDTIRMLNTAFSNYEMLPLEQALLRPQNGTPLKIQAKMDADGEYLPYAYPVKRDGSEYILIKQPVA